MVFENICNSRQWQIAENGSMDGGTGLQTDDIQCNYDIQCNFFFFKITKAQRAMLNINPVANKSKWAPWKTGIAVKRIFHANQEADGHTMEDTELWLRDASCKCEADGQHGKDRITGE